MTQPEHFDEHAQALFLLQEFGPRLAQEAKLALRENPVADIAGVIADSSSPEYSELRRFFKQRTGVDSPPEGFAGLLPRNIVAAFTQDAEGQTRETFAEFFKSDIDTIAILVCTRNGRQVARFRIPAADSSRP